MDPPCSEVSHHRLEVLQAGLLEVRQTDRLPLEVLPELRVPVQQAHQTDRCPWRRERRQVLQPALRKDRCPWRARREGRREQQVPRRLLRLGPLRQQQFWVPWRSAQQRRPPCHQGEGVHLPPDCL